MSKDNGEGEITFEPSDLPPADQYEYPPGVLRRIIRRLRSDDHESK